MWAVSPWCMFTLRKVNFLAMSKNSYLFLKGKKKNATVFLGLILQLAVSNWKPVKEDILNTWHLHKRECLPGTEFSSKRSGSSAPGENTFGRYPPLATRLVERESPNKQFGGHIPTCELAVKGWTQLTGGKVQIHVPCHVQIYLSTRTASYWRWSTLTRKRSRVHTATNELTSFQEGTIKTTFWTW